MDKKDIIPGTNYDPSQINLKITPIGIDGIYSIEYTAIRIDDLDGLIEGKTCKITFRTPKCLDQCYSCSNEGTEEKNECLNCVNDSY